MKSFSSNNPTPKTREEVQQWVNRIVTIQQNINPEKVEQIRSANVRSARALHSASRAYQNERCVRLASASIMSPLMEMRASATSNDNNISNSAVMTSYVQRNDEIRNIITSSSNNDNNNNYNDNIDERLALLETEAYQGTVFENTLQVYSSLNVDDEIKTLLKELEIEPNNDNEIKSKFLLFEEFSKNVDIIREAIYQFWIDNKDQFDNHVRIAIENEIKNIDNNESQSIQDDSQKWFVYFMIKGSHKNNIKMTEFLRNLRTRLELLAQTDLECPICLESLNDNNTYTMQCCHKMCIECYSHWLELKGISVFCPICKGVNEAFLPEIISNEI